VRKPKRFAPAFVVIRDKAILLRLPTEPSGPGELDLYWSSSEDADQLYHHSPEDAAEELINDLWGDPVPETIKTYGWRRRVLTPLDVQDLTESMIENLKEHWEDQDWADPESPHELSPAFAAALRAVCHAYLPREEVWGCERDPSLDVVVKVADLSVDMEVPKDE
jgi:hypothetical protein